MAYFRRLAALALLLSLLWYSSAADAAATCDQGVCDTQAQASAKCSEVAAYWSSQGQLTAGCAAYVFGPGSSNPAWTSTPLACGDGTMCDGTYKMTRGGSVHHYYLWRDGGNNPPPLPTEAQCLARNAEGVVDRMYIAGTAPSSYCNGNCTMSVSASPLSTSGGINPVTGASVTWGRYEQSYSGAVCSTSAPVNQDGNPENSMSVPAPGTTATQGSCDFAAGTCTDGKGQVSYCTFTGTGAAATPSSCVPAAGDSDSDGIPNDNDSAPNDPLNGKDTTGTESDNVSSGGGSCANPPTSSGDGILAQIAYQTWATRCAVVAMSNNSPTSGSVTVNVASPVVNVAANTAGNADLASIKTNTDNLNGSASFGDMTGAIPGEGVSSSDAFGTPGGTTPFAPDEGGFLTIARECPDLPDIPLPEFMGGQVIDLNAKFVHFCTFMEIGGTFIYLFGLLASIKIYSRVFT